MSFGSHLFVRLRPADLQFRARLFATLAAVTVFGEAAQCDPELHDVPLFDGHIHYNSNVWETIGPENAVDRLRSAGIQHALVSSTPTEGTKRLFALDPTRIIPLLRPYQSPTDRRTWFADPGLVPRLRKHLETFPYRGIGEFHVFGADASTPVMQEMIDLAVERGLFLHAHADDDAIVRIVERAPNLKVIWAHAGFDVPVESLDEFLARYPGLLIELSYRSDIAPLGTLAENWRNLFIHWPNRFLVGMDTHVGARWAELRDLASEARRWLTQLPEPVAHRIAFQNAGDLVGIQEPSLRRSRPEGG